VPIDGTDRDRILLANYGPERARIDGASWLDKQSRSLRDDHVIVDISPRFPGGDYPLRGHLELRSFKAIIAFLGRGLSEEPEYAVGKDSRTGHIEVNPASTLGIRETPQRPADAIFVVEERGHWYSIEDPPDRPRLGRWNRQAFDVLYQLFQLTVTDVSNVSTPTITIGK
jgi:hypothetical protein